MEIDSREDEGGASDCRGCCCSSAEPAISSPGKRNDAIRALGSDIIFLPMTFLSVV